MARDQTDAVTLRNVHYPMPTGALSPKRLIIPSFLQIIAQPVKDTSSLESMLDLPSGCLNTDQGAL